MLVVEKIEEDFGFLPSADRSELLSEIMRLSDLIQGIRSKLGFIGQYQKSNEEKFYQYVKARDCLMKRLYGGY